MSKKLIENCTETSTFVYRRLRVKKKIKLKKCEKSWQPTLFLHTKRNEAIERHVDTWEQTNVKDLVSCKSPIVKTSAPTAFALYFIRIRQSIVPTRASWAHTALIIYITKSTYIVCSLRITSYFLPSSPSSPSSFSSSFLLASLSYSFILCESLTLLAFTILFFSVSLFCSIRLCH